MMHKHLSLAEQVFERLESDILSGVYQKGEIVTEARLSDDLMVSRTPIREAMHRLEQEHLVYSTSKGIKILSITMEDAIVIYNIREHIEGMAAAACAKNISDEHIKELKEMIELQIFYKEKGDTEKIKEYDSRFHESIYLWSGSPVYYDTLFPLHNKVQKFRKSNVTTISHASESCDEHQLIFDAIEKRNAQAAQKAMTKHVKLAKERLIETIKGDK